MAMFTAEIEFEMSGDLILRLGPVIFEGRSQSGNARFVTQWLELDNTTLKLLSEAVAKNTYMQDLIESARNEESRG
jgi:hypothetical protein